jgi:hypothetical protein
MISIPHEEIEIEIADPDIRRRATKLLSALGLVDVSPGACFSHFAFYAQCGEVRRN